MRILYTITKSEIGGAQVHVMQLAKYMKDTGHAVAVVSYPGGWLENEATKLGVRFYPNQYFGNTFNPFRLRKSFLKIKKIVSEFNPDIVHAHSSFAGVITRLVVRNKIPIVFTAHSFAFTDGASLFRRLIAPVSERFVSKYTSKIICVSEFDKKLALRYHIAPPEKLVVIHNGVSSQLADTVREQIIVSVGRLAYPKEYGLLLEAFKQADIPMQLEIVGDGPDKQKIQEQIAQLGLASRVILRSNLQGPEEVRDELAKASVFILISKHEGLPMTILEAMAAGLPVIASRVGGIPEEIDSFCGILVNNTKEEIAAAIERLSHSEAQKMMGGAARKKFEQEFTLEKFLRSTESVYIDLMRKNNLYGF